MIHRSLILVLLLSTAAFAQLSGLEMGGTWQDTQEMLSPEEGDVPPDADVSTRLLMSRFRLLGNHSVPIFEMRGMYTNSLKGVNTSDLRMAGLLPLPLKGTLFKGVFLEKNLENGAPCQESSAYIIGGTRNFRGMIGLDYKDNAGMTDKIFSARLKYRYSLATMLGVVATQPDSIERFSFGAVFELPHQLMVSGMYAIWDDVDGYAVNIGRFNNLGDFNGIPSFALNHIEIPDSYNWTNFRIMWGDRGSHYVRPAFDNPVFSGMMDINLALMTNPLVSDNYRFFDSPLVFRRYDEYGTVAFRVNFLEFKSEFRKLDVNVNYNTGKKLLFLDSVRGVITYTRIHNPAFGWQNDRYTFTFAGYPFGSAFLGVNYGSDFDMYNMVSMELRVVSGF